MRENLCLRLLSEGQVPAACKPKADPVIAIDLMLVLQSAAASMTKPGPAQTNLHLVHLWVVFSCMSIYIFMKLTNFGQDILTNGPMWQGNSGPRSTCSEKVTNMGPGQKVVSYCFFVKGKQNWVRLLLWATPL